MSRRIYGIDFSGAQDAGNKIWITTAVRSNNGLRIKSCVRARELSGEKRGLEQALSALVKLIRENRDGLFGMDFPFGLPAELVKEKDWKTFVRSFDFGTPESFKTHCYGQAGKELKRATDRVANTPWSPYNLRLYKQTYYGIKKVLRPLVEGDEARVLPMQEEKNGLPAIVEVCPASTLKRMSLYKMSYKKNLKEHKKNRKKIANAISESEGLELTNDIRSKLIDDSGGDALDSVICAIAASKMDDKSLTAYKKEGFVYV